MSYASSLRHQLFSSGRWVHQSPASWRPPIRSLDLFSSPLNQKFALRSRFRCPQLPNQCSLPNSLLSFRHLWLVVAVSVADQRDLIRCHSRGMFNPSRSPAPQFQLIGPPHKFVHRAARVARRIGPPQRQAMVNGGASQCGPGNTWHQGTEVRQQKTLCSRIYGNPLQSPAQNLTRSSKGPYPQVTRSWL